jgi:serine/threonine protein kinase
LARIRDAHAAEKSSRGQNQDGLTPSQSAATAPIPPPASTLPPGLAEHPDYEILRELGRGGMGVVYLAQNNLMGRQEVLNVVSGDPVHRPVVRERFLREIQSAANRWG